MGYFVIKNVLPGTYNLYAWVPGLIGDYKYAYNIIIKPGLNILNMAISTSTIVKLHWTETVL